MSSDDLAISYKQGRVCKLLIFRRAKSISDRLSGCPLFPFFSRRRPKHYCASAPPATV
jgi:hypothetical protein